MTKLIALTCFIFAAAAFANAFDHREWSDGKLTWKDFQEEESEKKISELSYYFGFNSDNYSMNDTMIYHYKAIAYVNQKESWVDPDHKNQKTLEYNQTIFDIIEYHRRKLQYEFHRVSSESVLRYNYNYVKDDMTNEIEEFQEESQYGRIHSVVREWSEEYNEKLEESKGMNKLKFKDPLYGIGMNISVGRNAFTGSLNDNLTPGYGFILGFDFSFKRSMVFLNMTLGSVGLDYDYSGVTDWFNNDNPNFSIIDISYGYSIINNTSLRLTPFAGLGITELSESKQESGDPYNIIDYNIVFGINTDLKFFRFLRLQPDPILGSKNYGEVSGRLRLYVTRTNYYSDLKGYSINLGLGISYFSNPITL